MIDSESRESRAWAMLTARAQQYEVGSRSFGTLTPADVAAMLAGLDERPFSAGMLCEAGDWMSLPRVASFLYYDTVDLAGELEWDLPRGPKPLKGLVYLALIEATGPSVVCAACEDGKKATYTAGKLVSCRVCEGRGRLPVMQQTRFEMLGFDESSWRRRWRERYVRVDQILQGWIQDARDHLAEALAGRPKRRRAHEPADRKALAL